MSTPRVHGAAFNVDAVVIGAGHSGLAMSRMLAARGIEHVVLERGEIANAWRTERWDSLRLLTPNWQSRLPGYRYSGADPDGYMTSAEVGDFIVGYAKRSTAPVRTGTTVKSVRAATSSRPTARPGGAEPSCWHTARTAYPSCRASRRGCRAACAR
jgi:putative flavoprotein involved in K+ transport